MAKSALRLETRSKAESIPLQGSRGGTGIAGGATEVNKRDRDVADVPTRHKSPRRIRPLLPPKPFHPTLW